MHLTLAPLLWEQPSVENESLLFIMPTKKGPPEARLLFVPEGNVELKLWNYSGQFQEGVHFTLNREARRLTLLEPFALPFLKEEELFPEADSPSLQKMAHRKNNPSHHLLWSEDTLFHQHQVLASYQKSEQAPFWNPSWTKGALPRLTSLLKEGAPIKLAVSGDSISEGYNASAFLNHPPFQPPYTERFRLLLAKGSRSKISMVNCAVAGWNTLHGVKDAERPASVRPDLLILAYGMNDAGTNSPDTYKKNIETILQTVRDKSPNCEVLLLAPMTANFEWHCKARENFVALRDVLSHLSTEGIAFADGLSLFEEVVKRKSYYDITGNGLNHPNDFGHRLLAELLIALFHNRL